jgi:hypothetical protein
MGFSKNTQATRSTLMSVDSTLSEAITASQDYIPIASTTNFSTSVVAEIETTNEVVSFTDISQNLILQSQTLDASPWAATTVAVTADSTTAPDGTTTADTVQMSTGSGQVLKQVGLSLSAGTTYTLSFYVKKSVAGFFRLFLINAANNSLFGGWWNTDTGAWASTAAVSGGSIASSSSTAVGDGWYRVTITGANSGSDLTEIWIYQTASDGTTTRSTTPVTYVWGLQIEQAAAATTYLPTTSAALVGLTGVTRGVNGTTAQSASSSDSIQQLPYALSEVNMPVRLKAISVASDGTGVGRFTLCDKIGTTLCDIDIPVESIYDLDFGDDRGIIFPNGIFISNSDNITGYTLFTDKYSGPGLS